MPHVTQSRHGWLCGVPCHLPCQLTRASDPSCAHPGVPCRSCCTTTANCAATFAAHCRACGIGWWRRRWMRCACTPEWVGGGCHLGHTVPPCSSISISARAIGSRFVRQNGCERRSRLPSQVLHPEDALDRVCLRYLDGCFRENKQLAGTQPTRSCTDITELTPSPLHLPPRRHVLTRSCQLPCAPSVAR